MQRDNRLAVVFQARDREFQFIARRRRIRQLRRITAQCLDELLAKLLLRDPAAPFEDAHLKLFSSNMRDRVDPVRACHAFSPLLYLRSGRS